MMTLVERTREPLLRSLTRRKAHEVIGRNGFVEVPVNPEYFEPLVNRVVAGFDRLIATPERWKHFPWEIFATDGYGDAFSQEIGLRPPEKNKRGERKFTFHYIDEMVPYLLRCGVPVHEYSDFLGALRRLSHLGKLMSLAVAEAFDAVNRHSSVAYPGLLYERLRQGRFVIRLLCYLEQESHALELDLPDAAEHIDRGLFTPHFWSSHRGLYLYGPDRKRHEPDETSFSTVTIFPGEKFAAATRGQFGYGTIHGVRDKRRGGLRRSNRYAVVGFAHPIALPGDVNWLLSHKHVIEAYEKSFRLHPS